jgi:hypothetical protein
MANGVITIHLLGLANGVQWRVPPGGTPTGLSRVNVYLFIQWRVKAWGEKNGLGLDLGVAGTSAEIGGVVNPAYIHLGIDGWLPSREDSRRW